jgi:SAM-dependent methyltransferase
MGNVSPTRGINAVIAEATSGSSATGQSQWEELGQRERPSWYLDPLVARQKRQVHLELIAEWTAGSCPQSVLKTDLFEEGFGGDHILVDVAEGCPGRFGMDTSHSTALAAAKRFPGLRGRLVVTDARQAGCRAKSQELIVSTSTLDHFESREEFHAAIAELARVLLPGGLLVLTVDNPWNVLYLPLRLYSRTKLAPFYLGYTPSLPTLRRDLEALGLEIEGQRWLIHNPRMVSTLLFLAVRHLLGKRAGAFISFLLRCFSGLGKLPTRPLTACFQAVAARKRALP